MSDLINGIIEFSQRPFVITALRATMIIIAGFLIARFISAFLVRTAKSRLDSHRLMILRRGSYYLILVLFLTTALIQLGFDLSIFLGTAGIITVALAFASQTSMSNLISGVFLIIENPFQVGDVIQLGPTVGEVLEIDLLSVKLRKFDNTFVRLPNELLIKSEVWTLTKFPIRRLDLQIQVAYREDIGLVRETLLKVADKNPVSLQEPPPVFILRDYGESGVNLQFSVWVLKENYLLLMNSIRMEIKQAFEQAGIEIPFPHRTLYTGSITEPFPVQVVAGEAQQPAA